MTKRTGIACSLAIINLVLLVCASGCTAEPRQHVTQGSSAVNTRSSSGGKSHDLSADEEQGGHTLKRHVGRTDDQLQERLERERHISAASTYTDRQTAEQAVEQALQQNSTRIDRWMARTSGHPNLVLDYNADHTIGRVLNRGESQAVPCSNAVVVLKWSGPGHYYILTSYPECR